MRVKATNWQSCKNRRAKQFDTATIHVSYNSACIELELVRAHGNSDQRMVLRLTRETAAALRDVLKRGIEYGPKPQPERVSP